MREKSWRLMLGAIGCFAFIALFLSGAERLVAREKDERTVSPPRAVAAFLSEAHANTHSGERGETREMGGERQTRQASGLSPARVHVSLLLRSDANGRVLSSRSYLREVYEVFALGDGFA